jgi:hypothetical protein
MGLSGQHRHASPAAMTASTGVGPKDVRYAETAGPWRAGIHGLHRRQNGGGIFLLADRLGTPSSPSPSGSKRIGNVRLRNGDASALADYDHQHARIRSGGPEQMMEPPPPTSPSPQTAPTPCCENGASRVQPSDRLTPPSWPWPAATPGLGRPGHFGGTCAQPGYRRPVPSPAAAKAPSRASRARPPALGDEVAD